MKHRLIVTLFLYFVMIAYRASAIDLTADQERAAQRIFSTTMSPYCPGRLLSDCPSNSASELKENLRSRIAGGESAEQIELYLESVYGQGIHALPPTRGFGLVAWMTPLLFLVVGLILFKIWIKRNNQKLQATPEPCSTAANWNDEIDRQLKD